MTKIHKLLGLTTMLIVLGGSAATASPPAMAPIMKPVNAVLAAMNDHNPRTLSGAFATGAVIVDNQAPFQWSGCTAPGDWLSAISTWGKMRSAHFTATADPWGVEGAPGTAYVIVRAVHAGREPFVVSVRSRSPGRGESIATSFSSSRRSSGSPPVSLIFSTPFATKMRASRAISSKVNSWLGGRK